MEKERELIIKKVDKYELHFNGDNTYYSANTEEEKNKLAQRFKKEEKKRVKEVNNEGRIKKERNEKIIHNLSNYIQKLKKDYWHVCRNGTQDEKDNLKEEIENLRMILNRTLDVQWHQSYMDNSTYYSLDRVKKTNTDL